MNNTALPMDCGCAQAAMQLPEVQEMLRRLATYRLGIYMPHMHDEYEGGFQPLGHQVVQVESSLEVSFQSSKEIAAQPERWVWQDGAVTPSAVCEMVLGEDEGSAARSGKHKMVEASQDDSMRAMGTRMQRQVDRTRVMDMSYDMSDDISDDIRAGQER